MRDFKLAAQLQNDCHYMTKLELCHVLLHRNAAVPWFILVPVTDVIEIVDLSAQHQLLLMEELNRVSQFVREHFAVTKLNVAAIGNIVSQLHVHVIGRHPDDAYWPGVVWGEASDAEYSDDEVSQIKRALVAAVA